MEHGLDGRQATGLILGVLMVSGLPANLAAGWLARRRPMGELLAVGVAALALSLAVVHILSVLASATGPVVLAACRKYAGGTTPFFYVFAALAAVLAVLSRVVPAPVRSGPGGEGS